VTSLIGLLVGVVAAVGLVRFAHGLGAQRARRVYAVGLVVAALIYVGFAVVGRASARWLAAETIGLALYSAAAWAGLRHWPMLLALGWAAHVAWDVVLHLDGAGAAYTPSWYPWLCVSFDLVLTGAVLVQVRRGSLLETREAGRRRRA
jgi:hypothetical protein